MREVDEEGNPLEEGDMLGKYKVSYTYTEATHSYAIENNYQIDEDDLDIVKIVTRDGEQIEEAAPGDTLVYTITLTNKRACETALSVKVQDMLPEGLTVDEDGVNPETGTCDKDPDTGAYIWDITDLAPNTDAVLHITVTVPEDANNIRYENTASIIQVNTKTVDDPKSTDPVPTDIKTFKATKTWLDEKGNDESALHETESVSVSLIRDGDMDNPYDTQTLSIENDWTFTWTNLPLYQDGTKTASVYTVIENAVPEGFDVTYNYGGSKPSGSMQGNDTADVQNKRKEVKVDYQFVGEQPTAASTILPDTDTMGYGAEYDAASVQDIKDSPVSKGYTFDGWYNEETCETEYVDGTSIIADRTLYGMFTRNKIQVSFEYEGDVPVGQIPPESENINQYDTFDPSDLTPEEKGYEFKGWYEDEECTIPWDSTEELEDSVVIYGLWKEIIGTLKYDANGGEGAPEDQKMTYLEEATVSEEEPVRKGYDFLGWSEDIYAETPEYVGGDVFKNADEDPDDATLYAVWEAHKYTVIFDENAPDAVGEMDDQEFEYDVEEKLDGNAFVRPGYSFEGWALDPDALEADFEDMESVVNLTDEKGGEVKLYALWNELPDVVITYKVDDESHGSVSNDSETLAPATGVAEGSVAKENSGYEFVNWTDEAGEEVSTSLNFIPEKVDGLNVQATYTANFKPMQFKVTYTYKGDVPTGTPALPKETTQNANSVVKLEVDPSLRGYAFSGWKSDDVLVRKDNTFVMPVKNVKFVGTWKLLEYKITYDLDGGVNSEKNPAKYTVKDEVSLKEATRTDYTFLGWYDANGNKVTSIPKGSIGDVKLFARWQSNVRPAYTADNQDPVIWTYTAGIALLVILLMFVLNLQRKKR